MSYTELANHLQNNFNAADITLMTEDEWIDESQQLVNKVYSEVKNKDSLGYTYIYENFDLRGIVYQSNMHKTTEH